MHSLENTFISEIIKLPLLIQKLKTTIITHTETGLQLVPFSNTPQEIKLHEKWFNDHQVTEFLHHMTPFTDNSEQRVTVSTFIEYMTYSPLFAFFLIQHPEFGIVGHVSMNGINLEEKSFEVGVTVGET